MLGLLRRNIFNCSAEVKAIAYKALVRPRLEYCSAVWDPYHRTHINVVERIQRRAARFVSTDYSRETSATSLVQNLEWDTLEERRTKCRLITIYKEAHGLIPSNIDHLRHKIFTNLVDFMASTHSFILLSARTVSSIRSTQDQFLNGIFYLMGPRWHQTYSLSRRHLMSINVRDLVSKGGFKI